MPCAVKSITVPVLFAAMGGYTFIRDNEMHYELAASKDKDFIVVEGATHGATPCKECEKTPGQYSNSVKNFFDYVAKWINSRLSAFTRNIGFVFSAGSIVKTCSVLPGS